MLASEIVSLLRKKYPDPAYAFLTNVCNGVGSNATRWADGVAISCWPSRGLDILGFEIKVNRGDWLKELKTPEKSVAVQKYCDYWWVVAPVDIVNFSEVPSTWGWMVPKGGKLGVAKAAPVLQSAPLDRVFLASLLRNDKRNDGIDDELKRAFWDGEEAERKRTADTIQRHADIAAAEVRRVKDRIDRFEKASGVTIDTWGARIGEALKVFMEEPLPERVKRMLDQHKEELVELEKCYAKLAK